MNHNSLRIAILDMYDNVANEGMRCILNLIKNFEEESHIPLQYNIYNVRAEMALPDLSYDIYISTGGPGSPLESGESWEAPYFTFIDSIFAYNRGEEVIAGIQKPKYMFLICHSFQLVSRHLGIGMVSKRRSTSFGVFPVHRTTEAGSEPFFDGLPEPFYVVDSRDYQLVRPNKKRIKDLGVTILRLEKERPHVNLERAIMAIRFSKEVFGTQFHPEADGEGMLRYLQKEDKRQAVVKSHGLAKYNSMVEQLADPDKILLTESVILPNFLKTATSAIFKTTSQN
ncbi:type 1 glutamine amidotransferase [Flectobacillus rivi]|uniref:GMP synthase n=1 Tax=Flectobacillus rivi TaxID=2984209 RepID=A0ABT6Z4M7_9BACT|nr:GMP synthase [Flectobacillus rivi]MDI9876079.1 GMP synthase [Flectobacillus rivi]